MNFRSVFLFLVVQLLCASSLIAQLKICTWNLQNFGDSKDEEQIAFIAANLRQFDIVAVQEVLVGPGGARAVARLNDALNRTGSKWMYAISEPTTSYENMQQRERYAYLWKPSVATLKGKPFLDSQFEQQIEREPYRATFLYNGKEIELASFHALPKKKNPEQEIKYLQLFSELQGHRPIIFLGDFNCPQSHTVFTPLFKLGYKAALLNQKTTMKQECKDGECLASEYDNIFYPAKLVKVQQQGVVPFYKSFNSDMKRARKLSDHLPVFAEIYLN